MIIIMFDSERLTIRPLEKKDLEILRKMRLDYTTWHYLTDARPINDANQEKWFERISNDPTKMYFTIERKDNKNFVGILRSDEYDRINRSIRIGVDIALNQRSQGFGTEAMRALTEYLFAHLGLHRIWLMVIPENLPAIKLYLRLGFKDEGKHREAIFRDSRWYDYKLMSILENEWKKNIK